MRAAFSSKPRAEKGSAKPRALYHLTNAPCALKSLFCSKTLRTGAFSQQEMNRAT
jgi:hypothetical protein